MSKGARRLHYTYEEYVALEEASPTRHEYWQGEHRREGDTWHSADVHAGDAIELSCTDEPLDVDALYARGLEDV